MSSPKDCAQQVWGWLCIRLLAAWSLLKWLFNQLCCCALCLEGGEEGQEHRQGNSLDFAEKGLSPQVVIGAMSNQQQASGGGQSGGGGQVHKVIMVGSGGVGKSALTLQFMYDEVGEWDGVVVGVSFGILKILIVLYKSPLTPIHQHTMTFSSSRSTSLRRPTATGSVSCWTVRTAR